jgi:tetrahydromethanopterin S-methyltransferase subunit E
VVAEEADMGIGASVFLIALGAILAFAVRDTTVGGWLDISTAGWVLMIAGLLGLVVTLIVWGRQRSTVVDRPGSTTYERRVIDDEPR